MSNSVEEKRQRAEQLVNNALLAYRKTGCGSAGYDVLRYSKKGWIRVAEFVSPNEFASWYPLDCGYIFLRLAKRNALLFNEDYVFD